jgi:sarcosine oxidase subunit delta
MLEIKCPYCGKRSQNEFAYGGEVSTKDWDNFVYYRDNPRGKHTEYWHHVSGCRQWFKASRDTATHEIFKTSSLEEEL